MLLIGHGGICQRRLPITSNMNFECHCQWFFLSQLSITMIVVADYSAWTLKIFSCLLGIFGQSSLVFFRIRYTFWRLRFVENGISCFIKSTTFYCIGKLRLDYLPWKYLLVLVAFYRAWFKSVEVYHVWIILPTSSEVDHYRRWIPYLLLSMSICGCMLYAFGTFLFIIFWFMTVYVKGSDIVFLLVHDSILVLLSATEDLSRWITSDVFFLCFSSDVGDESCK